MLAPSNLSNSCRYLPETTANRSRAPWNGFLVCTKARISSTSWVGLLEKVPIKKEHFLEAARLKRERKLPFADLLHAIIARDNGAIMVTRDVHFEDFENIVTIRKPEDLF